MLRRPLCETHEGQDGQNNDNEADDIDDAVHVRTPLAQAIVEMQRDTSCGPALNTGSQRTEL